MLQASKQGSTPRAEPMGHAQARTGRRRRRRRRISVLTITLQIFAVFVLCVSVRAAAAKGSSGIQEDGGIFTGADDELGSSCSAGTSSSDDMAPKQQSDTRYGVDQQTIFSQKISTEDLNVQVTNYILSLLEHHVPPTAAEALNDLPLAATLTIIVSIIVARIMFVGVMLGILGGVCCSVPIVLVARYHCPSLAEKSGENDGGRNILEAMDGDDASQDDDTGSRGRISDIRSVQFSPGTKVIDSASNSRPPRFRNKTKGSIISIGTTSLKEARQTKNKRKKKKNK